MRHSDDPTADSLKRLPHLYALYNRLIALYTTYEGCMLVSRSPFFIYQSGEVCGSDLSKMWLVRPAQVTQFREAFGELLMISLGLDNSYYDLSEAKWLETRAVQIDDQLDTVIAEASDGPHPVFNRTMLI